MASSFAQVLARGPAPIDIPEPQEMEAAKLEIRRRRAEAVRAEQQQQAQQAAIEGERRFHQAIIDGGGDVDRTARRLSELQVPAKLTMDWLNDQHAWRKQRADATTAENELARQEFFSRAQELDVISKQPDPQAAYAEWFATLQPEQRAGLPPQWDPNAAAFQRNRWLARAQTVENVEKARQIAAQEEQAKAAMLQAQRPVATPQPPAEVQMFERWMKATPEERAEMERFKQAGQRSQLLSPEVEAQRIRINTAAAKLAQSTDSGALVAGVLEQPMLFDALTPTQRQKILPQLMERGFVYEGKPLSPEAQKVMENAQSGLRAVAKLRKMIQEDKTLLIKAAIPGSLGARAFSAARGELADVITRLRTGAALNREEETFYAGQAPTLLDLTEPEAIEYKLGLFESLFGGLSQRKTVSPVSESAGKPTGQPPAAAPKATAAAAIVQHSPSTGAYRHSTDGGKTWQPGQPPAR